ncbi:MAG: membrane-associated phospholipid phosphatase [Planctomycetota bacterium]|jgi:membrane-associated phospholipid phosphatase
MPSSLFTWFYNLSKIPLFAELSLLYVIYIPIFLIFLTICIRYRLGVYGKIQKTLGFLHEISVLGIVLGAAWAVAQVLKYIFQVPRPFLLYPESITPLVDMSSYSFPSGHAAVLMALAVWMIGMRPKWFGVFLVVAALLGGLSRIVAGVHTPLDVVAGWALGYIVGYLAYSRYRLYGVL